MVGWRYCGGRAGEDRERGVEAGEAHCVLPGSSVSAGGEQRNATGLWSWFRREEVTSDLIALLLGGLPSWYVARW